MELKMTKKKTPHSRTPSVPEIPFGPLEGLQEMAGETTGKYLVLFREGATNNAVKALGNVAGLADVVRTADFEEGMDLEQVAKTPVVVFDKLGVAVVTGDPQQMGAAMAAAADEESDILAVEPERIMYALAEGPPAFDSGAAEGGGRPLEYLRGYRDAVVALYEHLSSGSAAAVAEPGIAETFLDDAVSTWGLKATRAVGSRFDGRGIRVAVLDTGMDFNHPDFLGRLSPDHARSFISGEQAQDGHGHGTHCIGTSCGPQRPGVGPRYGIAFRAEIFVGKVLSNAGSGPDTSILGGIDWAITNRCQIISMSLGSPVNSGESFSPIYENVAQRALRAGSLIIAAAGNESRGPNGVRLEPPLPVGRPANCPSIMAVAALDNNLRIASFSNGGINPNGGGVDIAGPGVNILSSAPMPTRTRFLSGTSMATPHVAGLAALWTQARDLSGAALAQALISSARRLSLQSRDVGSGLAQASQ
jgi:subtilisin